MSELKGQLLGIILVILLFGGVATILASAFKTTASKIQTNATVVFDDASDVLAGEAYNAPIQTYYM